MEKKRIALLTPVHPQKTGIADYIEEMLPYLRRSLGDDFEIDLFVDDCKPTSEDILLNHRFFPIEYFETMRQDYSLCVYQMGNNNLHIRIFELALKYPGLLVMHDFAIHNMVAYYYLEKLKSDTAYFQAVEDNHGRAARDLAYRRAANGELGLWETDAIDYPMNRTVTQCAKGVIVFSEYARKRLLAYDDAVPIHRVYLHCSGKAQALSDEEISKARRQLKLHIKRGESLICVFGFIGRAKRPYSILEAARKLKQAGQQFKLIFVGKLQDDCKDLPATIRKMGLQGMVSITGFTSGENFDRYVRAADVCISLRYPTMGETSGVLMRALRYGKPSVVTNIGTFEEFPDDTVVKIGCGETEVDELTEALKKLLGDVATREAMAKKAVQYAAAHLEPQSTADSFAGFVKELIAFEQLRTDPMYLEMRDKMLDTYNPIIKTDGYYLYTIAHRLCELFPSAAETDTQEETE